MTRAFITGVCGQDGSYLSELLAAEGVDVHGLHLPGEPTDHLPEGVVLHPGDLTDVDGTRDLVLTLAPDEVYNLAAFSSVALSWERPELTARVNAMGAVGLMESALQAQEKSGHLVRFVQASSAEIFGSPTVSPQDERTRLQPMNPYGASKAYAHVMAGVYRQRDLHAISTVLYNHESPRRPLHFVSRKITSTVAAIAQGRADSLALGNVEAKRDWGWAPDFVEAMVLAARADVPDDYVIATGRGHTVRDFVDAAFRHVGIDDWQPLVTTDPGLIRPVDVPDNTGDPGHAAAVLGWRPTVGFEELVTRMVDADLGR